VELRILVDNCSVEVFVNEGEAVITELVFPAAPAGTLALYAAGGAVDLLSLDIWQIA
jgi:fructan beta-fructosidase